MKTNTKPIPKQVMQRPNGKAKASFPISLAAIGAIWCALFVLLTNGPDTSAANAALLGWNNLGMHCMDNDFSVFCTLPPYNTIEAQLIVNGLLVTNGSNYTVTYEAIADPDGSINTTSQGKINFWQFTPDLFGPMPADTGLLGWSMPGPNNVPQNMLFENYNSPTPGVSTPANWFRAEGIPASPYDDAGRTNSYPMMRLVARDAANNIVATSDIVVPISDEMDCSACHASGGSPAAKPVAGWVNDPNPTRDYRLNILRLHDELQDSATYPGILSSNGFNSQGLYQSVVNDNHPVLCAKCHLSEALPGSGYGNIPPLNRAIHSLHALVTDPSTGMALNDAANRSACYRCHPGSTTQCLRGAMGSAIASDGSQEMQCQSCHGTMSDVAAPTRVGWFMEPACQSCHSGTAIHNNGQIRYTSALDANGVARTAVDQTFATTPNTPAPGLSLYRFSVGHGGLQCAACHGSPHAIFPTSHRNDNIESSELQGHAGTIAECTACHATMPGTVNGGPHGMHPIGQTWVSQHQGAAEHNSGACQSCHGIDYRGTVLSLVKGDRTLSAFGTQNFFRGAIIGCYTCHNGPGGEGTPGPAPTVSDVSATTAVGQSVDMTLPVSGTGATLRIISQPADGSVGLINGIATYFPPPGFTGTATFTFAAYNGSRNSNLGTGTVTVGTGGNPPPPPPPPSAPVITVQPASQTVTAGANVTFSVTATGTAPLAYQWQKDGVNINGATSQNLTLSIITTADAGSYRVIVSNSSGSATSALATLTVNTVSFTVALTSPLNGAVYTEPADVRLTAQVSPSGSADRVRFYDGTSFLGSASEAPYTITARDLGSGVHVFTAKATSYSGTTVTSVPVQITVNSRYYSDRHSSYSR
ncbi:MAG: immunoglobulin domain-containing protein, partial [Candidatus Omnitrophica bacterium]|nr:immunoglobulin domain-containing protein [Candidatus Omnitrophota bacterium]